MNPLARELPERHGIAPITGKPHVPTRQGEDSMHGRDPIRDLQLSEKISPLCGRDAVIHPVHTDDPVGFTHARTVSAVAA